MEGVERKCRLCLRLVHEPFVNIFVEKYAEQILDILSVELEEEKNWPSNACYDCIEVLDQIALFKEQIMNSHKSLWEEIYLIKEVTPAEEVVKESMVVPPAIELDASVTPDEIKVDDVPVVEDIVEEDTIGWDDIAYDSDVDFESPQRTEEMNSDSSASDNFLPYLPGKKGRPKSKDQEPKKKQLKRTPEEIAESARKAEAALEAQRQIEEVMLARGAFLCRECEDPPKDIKTLKEMHQHVLDQHDASKYDICCDLPIYRSQDLVYDHFRWHLNPEAFKCPLCSTCFKSSEYLKGHTKEFHVVGDAHICSACGGEFKNKRRFQRHIMMKHREFKCHHCPKVFARKGTLYNHVYSQHELIVNCLCDLCGRGFPNLPLLKCHIKDHGGPHGGKRKSKYK